MDRQTGLRSDVPVCASSRATQREREREINRERQTDTEREREREREKEIEREKEETNSCWRAFQANQSAGRVWFR
jgi:hypothetical protein